MTFAGFGQRLAPGPLPAANLTVESVAQDKGGPVGGVVYWVVLACCRRRVKMSHNGILRRATDARRRAEAEGRILTCHKCRGRPAAGQMEGAPAVRPRRLYQPTILQDYGITPPAWPRPAAGAVGYWRWEDPRA
jgi:hypothetical protein